MISYHFNSGVKIFIVYMVIVQSAIIYSRTAGWLVDRLQRWGSHGHTTLVHHDWQLQVDSKGVCKKTRNTKSKINPRYLYVVEAWIWKSQKLAVFMLVKKLMHTLSSGLRPELHWTPAINVVNRNFTLVCHMFEHYMNQRHVVPWKNRSWKICCFFVRISGRVSCLSVWFEEVHFRTKPCEGVTRSEPASLPSSLGNFPGDTDPTASCDHRLNLSYFFAMKNMRIFRTYGYTSHKWYQLSWV